MSTKMKRVGIDSSSHMSYEDDRARFKHQTLFQDFMELQQETEAQRNQLLALKQKKLTLKAEVRFLRQRHKFLINNKSSTSKEHTFVKPQPTQIRKSKKEMVNIEKQTNLVDLKKRKAPQSVPKFDLNLGNESHVKEQSVQRTFVNQRVRINGPKINQRVRINGPKINPFLDLGPKNNFVRGQEPRGQKRPVIDLNQISREEEEVGEQCEPLDLRVLGSGAGGRVVKRKISWQDPVALSVWGS